MDYNKPPFFVVKNFISPLQCEIIINKLNHTFPNTDQAGNPTVTYKGNKLTEDKLLPTYEAILPTIENYFDFQTKTTTPFVYEWYPTGYSGAKAKCESARYMKRKGSKPSWVKVKDYDFTCAIFLNDYNDGLDFDPMYEVRGGKLEFPTHGFGFNPTRGLMVVFPSRPQFVNAVAPVDLGDLTLIRFSIVAQETYNYSPESFQGDYTRWFF